MIATIDEAYKLLSPYFEKILQCVLKANKEQREAITPSSRAKARKRTESNFMNDLVTHHLRSEFNGVPGITITEKYSQIQILFSFGSSGFRMKAKQANRKKPVSCIPTQLAMNFLNQVEQLQLPSMPHPFTNVILYFEWNKVRTEIIKVGIKCPQDEMDCAWDIPIPISRLPEFIELRDQKPVIPPFAERRVTPKKRNVKRAKKNIRRINNERKGETDKP